MAGDYLAATYFQAIDRPQNGAFLEKWRSRYGTDRAVTDNMVAAYTGVHLWAKAVAKAGTIDPEVVTEAVGGVEFEGPSGRIMIDPENRHAWRPWRVGQVRADGTVEVVTASTGSVRADPFPATRTRHEWERLLTGLYVGWGGRWQAPAQP
jgi:urea transport system substrate-binding protein